MNRDLSMIKGSERRQPEQALGRIFVERRSPRAMAGEELPGQPQARETSSERRPLTQSICEGPCSP